MKNFLKEKFQYEVQLLENPNIEDIKTAIQIAQDQMNSQKRKCSLLIYYTGIGKRYLLPQGFDEQNARERDPMIGVISRLSQKESFDLR